MEILSVKPEGCKALMELTHIDAPYPAGYRTQQFTIICEAGIVQIESSGHEVADGVSAAGRICARMCVSCPSRPHATQAIRR